MNCPVTHLIMLSLSLSCCLLHTQTYTCSSRSDNHNKTVFKLCNLCKLDQNSSMLGVMTMEHDTENITLVPASLSFWFHRLFLHQTEQTSQNILWRDLRLP